MIICYAKRYLIPLVVGGLLTAVGFGVGIAAHKFTTTTTTTTTYKLINPTVTSDLGKHFIINFGPLKKKLVAIKNNYPEKTYLYFAYLNNASWVGLGEKDYFYAASTTKVPLAMATLKAVEEGKLSLDAGYTLEELDLNKDFGELYKVGTDGEFTVGELLKIMLMQSDNTATMALFHIFNKIGIDNPFEQVYNAMGWEFIGLDAKPDYRNINLKVLSNMFLTLYNAKYVNAEHSQMILEYLANTPFDSKIAAGVPDGVAVAHKVGIADEQKTYSDCGIVYAPNRHYLLCLGMSGADQDAADKFMEESSAAVYKYVIEN